MVRRMWPPYLARGRYIGMAILVGRCREDGRRYDEKRPGVLPGASGASTQPVSTPEEGYDEDYDYENISKMRA